MALPCSATGSLRPAFAPARLVRLAVKRPYAFTLEGAGAFSHVEDLTPEQQDAFQRRLVRTSLISQDHGRTSRRWL